MGIGPRTGGGPIGGTAPDRHPIVQQTLLDGVFKGGGSLGAAYPGVLKALAARNHWFQRVAGTSAGAILASMIAAGFDAAEIEFLCAPTTMNLPRPAALPAVLGAHEVNYTDFVDIPSPHDLAAAKEWRHSLAWLSARQMVDTIAAKSGKLPNQVAVLDAILGAVAGVLTVPAALAQPLKNAIDAKLPKELQIADILAADVGTRDGLADAVFLAGAVANPIAIPANAIVGLIELVGARLGLTGGLCKGDVFLNRMRRIIGAKVAAANGGPVLFRHLPKDLFVTASNMTRESLIVYSKRRTPDMEVAEAVRRSMSVPLVWERRVQAGRDPADASQPVIADAGDEIVDGGVVDNLPLWLFLTPTNNIVENTDADLARTKFVGLLDGGADAPASWQAPPPPASSPSPDDAMKAFMDMLKRDPARNTWEAQLILRLYQLYDVTSNGGALGQSVTAAYARGGGASVVGVDIPLKGFGWLDWDTTAEKFKAMAFRGWESTINSVQGSRFSPVLLQNPYRS